MWFDEIDRESTDGMTMKRKNETKNVFEFPTFFEILVEVIQLNLATLAQFLHDQMQMLWVAYIIHELLHAFKFTWRALITCDNLLNYTLKKLLLHFIDGLDVHCEISWRICESGYWGRERVYIRVGCFFKVWIEQLNAVCTEWMCNFFLLRKFSINYLTFNPHSVYVCNIKLSHKSLSPGITQSSSSPHTLAVVVQPLITVDS